MKQEHGPISNFHKKELILSIVMGLLISESKRYGIRRICARLKDVENEKVGQQVLRPVWKEIISNSIRGFTCTQRKRIVEYKLYIREHFEIERGIFKCINKKPQYDLHYLVSVFAKAINLKVVSYVIQQFDSQPSK